LYNPSQSKDNGLFFSSLRGVGRGSRAGLFSNVSVVEFFPLRFAPINRDVRDIVDFVDVFPFLNHTRYTKQGLPHRRNYVCPALNPPDIQSFLRPLNFYPDCPVGGCHRTGVKPYRLTGTEGQESLPLLAPLNRVYPVKCLFLTYFTGVPLGCSTGAAPVDSAGVLLWFILNKVGF